MQINISDKYKDRNFMEIMETVAEEIQYHIFAFNQKPKKIYVAPYYEWDLYKEGKTVMVICLPDVV